MYDHELFLNILKCAVCGVPFQTTEEVDLQALWTFAHAHSITATITPALTEAGLLTDLEEQQRWTEELHKNYRKTMMFDVEREAVFRILSENGIWYAPLKGIMINHLYPLYGLREFADNDILIDASLRNKTVPLMESLGYTLDRRSMEVHYTFSKQPLLEFELHHTLFVEKANYKNFYNYFRNIQERLVLQGNDRYAYQLTDNDSYLYFLAHAYKHYIEAGTGLKTLADVYLCLQKLPLDRGYIAAEVKKLGITDFVDTIESLSQKVFGGKDAFSYASLTEDEREMLDDLIEMGSYGRYDKSLEARFQEYAAANGKMSRLGYYRSRLIPGMEEYKNRYPFIYRHKALHPVFYFSRMLRTFAVRRKSVLKEIKAVRKHTLQEKSGQANGGENDKNDKA